MPLGVAQMNLGIVVIVPPALCRLPLIVSVPLAAAVLIFVAWTTWGRWKDGLL